MEGQIKKLEKSVKVLRNKNRKLENENIRLDERAKASSEFSAKFVSELASHKCSLSTISPDKSLGKEEESEENPSKKTKTGETNNNSAGLPTISSDKGSTLSAAKSKITIGKEIGKTIDKRSTIPTCELSLGTKTGPSRKLFGSIGNSWTTSFSSLSPGPPLSASCFPGGAITATAWRSASFTKVPDKTGMETVPAFMKSNRKLPMFNAGKPQGPSSVDTSSMTNQDAGNDSISNDQKGEHLFFFAEPELLSGEPQTQTWKHDSHQERTQPRFELSPPEADIAVEKPKILANATDADSLNAKTVEIGARSYQEIKADSNEQQARIVSLENEHNSSTEKIQTLEVELNSRNNEVDTLKETINVLQEDKTNLEGKVFELQLNLKLDQAMYTQRGVYSAERTKESTHLISDLRQKIVQLENKCIEKEMQERKIKLDELVNQNSNVATTFNRNKVEVQKLKDEILRLKFQCIPIDQLKDENKKATVIIQHREIEAQRLKDEMLKQKAEVFTLQAQVSKLKEEFVSINELKDENRKATAIIQHKEIEAQRLKDEMLKQKAEVFTLQAQVSKLKVEFVSMNELKNDNERATAIIQDKENEGRKAEVFRLQAEASVIDELKKDNQTRITIIQKKEMELKKLKNEMLKQKEDCTFAIDEFRRENKILEIQNVFMKKDITQLKKDLDERKRLEGEPCPSAVEAATIKLKLVGEDRNVIHFKVKKNTQFGKLKRAYSEHAGVSVSSLRFRFEGQRINDDDTPAKLELEEGDIIEAYPERT